MASKNVILRIGTKGARKALGTLGKVSGSLANLGAKAAVVSAGFAGLSAKLAGDFQQNLLEISTLLDKNVDSSLNRIEQSLKNAASASGLALDSLSKAQYDIISAGFSNAADSAEVLDQSVRLAVGGVTSAAHAADLLTTAINSFGGSSADAQRISDVLFTTVKEGKTTISELGGSIGLVLPFAKSFNLSIEDVGAALAVGLVVQYHFRMLRLQDFHSVPSSLLVTVFVALLLFYSLEFAAQSIHTAAVPACFQNLSVRSVL